MVLAHRKVDSDGNILEQTLEEHLSATGELASEIGRTVGLRSFMKLAGYIHDCGKASRIFQDLLFGRTKQMVNHSSAGGRILDDFINYDNELVGLQQTKGKFAYFQEILSYIIFAHHGLFDMISYGSTEHKIHQRLKYDENADYYYIEDVVPFMQKFNLKIQEHGGKSIIELIREAYKEFELIYFKLVKISNKNFDKEKGKEEKEYYIACLTRLCLSILKEADIYNSANAFHNPKQYFWKDDEKRKIWEDASKKVEHMYQVLESTSNLSEMNEIRNNLANMAKKSALKNRNGIFKLELPTGAGKTRAGLRYALINAKEYSRNRIYYITAYLSILEQNAADIRSILDMDDVILEHHSNFIDDYDIVSENSNDLDEYNHQSYLRESWESPFILTTMVQFCNTLFKERASNIRRFCKLINSVIVIDEVQSLPLKVISNFNLMMNFMKEVMNCNIVHCTATQPVLENEAMMHPIHYGNELDAQTEIVNIDVKSISCFQRVDFYNLTGKDAENISTTENLSSYIKEELILFDTCLVILNTKSAVSKLYDYLEKAVFNAEIIYLTTNLCAAHRLKIISEMNNKLKQNRNEGAHHKIICISTQVIEAGVDVDFDIVFRSLTAIDSLIQCAGRCNREGKLNINGKKTHGKVFIIKFIEENFSELPDIKAAVDAAEYAIRSIYDKNGENDNKIIVEKLYVPYFNKYYVSNRNKLDYIDLKRNSTMIEELGKNKPDRDSYLMVNHTERKPIMFQAFRSAGENFQLIEQGTTGVIVTYHNQELLNKLELAIDEKDYNMIKILLQKLQRYCIDVYLSPKLEPFIYRNGYLGIYFLPEKYYNANKGITII